MLQVIISRLVKVLLLYFTLFHFDLLCQIIENKIQLDSKIKP